MTAGELLRTIRRKHGLTQRQLATRARTSRAAISRIERDLVSPAVSTLAELLRLMNEELVLEAREVDWAHDVTLIREPRASGRGAAGEGCGRRPTRTRATGCRAPWLSSTPAGSSRRSNDTASISS